MLGFADTCLSAGSLAEDSVEAPNVTGHVAGRFTLHRAFLAWSLPSPPSRPVREAGLSRFTANETGTCSQRRVHSRSRAAAVAPAPGRNPLPPVVFLGANC